MAGVPWKKYHFCLVGTLLTWVECEPFKSVDLSHTHTPNVLVTATMADTILEMVMQIATCNVTVSAYSHIQIPKWLVDLSAALVLLRTQSCKNFLSPFSR